MKMIVKYFLALLGIVIIFLVLNFILSFYYIKRYDSSVKSTANSFYQKEISEDLHGTYSFLSDKRKELNPFDTYLKNIQTSTAPKATKCKIVRITMNSVIGTDYFGPEATTKASCEMTNGETLINELKWIRQNNNWKISQ